MTIWDDRIRSGVLVTSCNKTQLLAKKNEELKFSVPKNTLADMKRLNMDHCYKSKFLSSELKFPGLNETQRALSRNHTKHLCNYVWNFFLGV